MTGAAPEPSLFDDVYAQPLPLPPRRRDVAALTAAITDGVDQRRTVLFNDPAEGVVAVTGRLQASSALVGAYVVAGRFVCEPQGSSKPLAGLYGITDPIDPAASAVDITDPADLDHGDLVHVEMHSSHFGPFTLTGVLTLGLGPGSSPMVGDWPLRDFPDRTLSHVARLSPVGVHELPVPEHRIAAL